MAYKYFTSSSPPYFQSSQNYLRNEFQQNLTVQFYNAPDVFTVQEETSVGSNSYSNIDVRVNSGINSYTGEKLGDDWKNIIFGDITHTPSLGTKYIFDSNTWLTVNTEVIKNLASGLTVRRCNNVLRWIDSNGDRQTEPCSIDYTLSRPKDQIGTIDPIIPQGYMVIYCQLNSRTKYIKGNQRFLFGPVENRIAVKVFGRGVKNYMNQITSDDTSATVLELHAEGHFVNPNVDDIIAGYANAYLDYGNFTSASMVGALSIIVTPDTNYILESASALFDVRYYSGSVIHSGSFVFTVSGSNVPSTYYAFAQETANTFIVYNLQKYPYTTLDILASGSSGSRMINLELRGTY